MDSAPSTTSAAPAKLLSLPRELRNLIYAYVLVDDERIDLVTGSYHWLSLSPQLLRTNKKTHDEATQTLYALNRFNLTNFDPDHHSSLLDYIGPNNSKYIRHVRIDFPLFESLDPGKAVLKDHSVRVLEKLKECCGTLQTLTTSRYSINCLKARLDDLEDLNVVTEAFKLVNTHFTAFSQTVDKDNSSPPLSIVVEAYEESLSDETKSAMKGFGWTIDIEGRYGGLFIEEDDDSYLSGDDCRDNCWDSCSEDIRE